MRLLILAATLISPFIIANELPPGLDLTEEQRTREVLGKWILGVPYEARLRKDQEVFRNLHKHSLGEVESDEVYDPEKESVQIWYDRKIPLSRMISMVFKPLGFTPDLSSLSDETKKTLVSINNEENSFSDVMRYLEKEANINFLLYPREAGGLVLVNEN